MQITQAIAEFVSGYFSTHERSKKTRTAYVSDLEQFAKYAGRDVELETLSGVLIERWAGHLRQDGYAPASMRRKMVVLKVFCAYWLRRGKLAESPFWRVHLSLGRIEHLPRALTEVEIKELLAQAGREHVASDIPRKSSALIGRRISPASSRPYRALRNFALVDLLFATGMRVGEASTLNVQDYTTVESTFRIQGKGGRHRLAYLVDEQTVLIQRKHLAERAKLVTTSPALFLNSSGERLSTQGMANIIAKFRREAGIERHITPHMLRHTVATLLLRHGMDIRVVQEFLGHASIATTQRYTHVVKEHLIGELRKHHPSLGLRAGAGSVAPQ
jgi:integrase/recombinase XerD